MDCASESLAAHCSVCARSRTGTLRHEGRGQSVRFVKGQMMARFRVLGLLSLIVFYKSRSLLVGAKAVVLTVLLLVSLRTQWSQTDPSAGIIPFSVRARGVYESVDLATRNINRQIPILNKPGTIPFPYKLLANYGAYGALTVEAKAEMLPTSVC